MASVDHDPMYGGRGRIVWLGAAGDYRTDGRHHDDDVDLNDVSNDDAHDLGPRAIHTITRER
ncbi:MAG: hypothetical protein R6W79_07915 [Acidimicrobiia bacterium]